MQVCWRSFSPDLLMLSGLMVDCTSHMTMFHTAHLRHMEVGCVRKSKRTRCPLWQLGYTLLTAGVSTQPRLGMLLSAIMIVQGNMMSRMMSTAVDLLNACCAICLKVQVACCSATQY
jgi:hypothetical protein